MQQLLFGGGLALDLDRLFVFTSATFGFFLLLLLIEQCLLLGLLCRDVLILEVLPVQVLNALALIDNGQEPIHRQFDLLNHRVTVELLAHLQRDDQVGAKLILLNQQHIPELVQVLMRLQAQLFGPPGSADAGPVAFVGKIVGEHLEILLCAG